MADKRRNWLLMSARFLIRSLRLRAFSLVLALVAVTVGAAVAATMLTLRSDLGAKMSRELRRFGPNLIVTSGQSGAAGVTPPLLDETLLRSVPGLHPSPLLLATGELSGADRSTAVATAVVGADFATAVVGADFPALRAINPEWRVEGEWPDATVSYAARETPARPGCLIGVALARRAGLRPGDAAAIALSPSDRRDIDVAGVVSTGESEDDQIFVPLAWLQATTGRPGQVSLAAYAVDGGAEGVARAAALLVAAIPGAAARPLRPIAAAQGALLGKLNRMMLLLTTVVLILSGLCLATTLMAMVVERESEIGLMRSLGAGDGDVMRVLLGEVSLLGVGGGLAGIALGMLGARLAGWRLFGAAIDPRLSVIPLVLLISLAVCWLAVLVPLRRALLIQPAAALRGE